MKVEELEELFGFPQEVFMLFILHVFNS